MRRGPRVDFHDDVDSEGNDPPADGEYVDPNAIPDTAPPRGNEPIQLPFYKPKERRNVREKYESRVSFEDWVEDAEEAGARNRAAGVVKLEDDSDFPVGRPYYWHAYCPKCNRSYHPHVPGMWACLGCQEKVWQQPDDPESRNCAVCRREVASMVTIAGKRIRNPMSLSAHMCKRCGRVVCRHCYSPNSFSIPELGYKEDQRVCTRCAKNVQELSRAPEDDDMGTLYEEHVVGDVLERNLCHRFWVPKCNRCNITFTEPPKRWLCTSCALPVWQPPEAPDSMHCWLCGNMHPKVRCHDCGQLVCYSCGAYAQPLPGRGFSNLNALSVCRGCYRGASIVKKGEEVAKAPMFRAKCSQCKKPCGGTPDMWVSKCHRAKAWQSEGSQCAVCAIAVQPAAGDNCRRCGRLVCHVCVQYKEPVPERGYDKGEAQHICKECYRPDAALAPDHSDYQHWPPSCPRCELKFARPPDRWRCPNQCGAVWQSPDHMASRCCWCCGRKMGGQVVNCRRCGRLVCSSCGEGRSQIPELGFTRGLEYPTCKKCLAPKPVPPPESEALTPSAPSSAPATSQAQTPMPGAGKTPTPTSQSKTPVPARLGSTPTPTASTGAKSPAPSGGKTPGAATPPASASGKKSPSATSGAKSPAPSNASGKKSPAAVASGKKSPAAASGKKSPGAGTPKAPGAKSPSAPKTAGSAPAGKSPAKTAPGAAAKRPVAPAADGKTKAPQ